MPCATDHMTGLTAEQLRLLVAYDPLTGEFRWITQPGNSKKPLVGRLAGVRLKAGYRQIKIEGRKYKAARLAWLYMTGAFPTGLVDHHDLNRENDRWANLRLATNQQNSANRAAYRGSRTGIKGVQYRAGRGLPWVAQIRVNNKLNALGSFPTKEAAAEAYINAAKSAFGEYARAG